MDRSRSFEALVRLVSEGLAVWTPKIERKLLEACLENVSAVWESSLARGRSSEALDWLQARRHGLSRELSESLRRRLQQELTGLAAAAEDDPPTVDSPHLSLMADLEVEGGIEQVRIERSIDLAADWVLQELNPLCAGLLGRQEADPSAAYPMGPATCAEAFVEALQRMGCPTSTQLSLMRFAGPVMGRILVEVYTEHLEALRAWGVAPAPLRIRLTPRGKPLDLGLSIAPSGKDEAEAEMDRVFQPAAGHSLDVPAAWAHGQPLFPGRAFASYGVSADAAEVETEAGGLAGAQASAAPAADLHALAMARFASQLGRLIGVLERQSQAGPVMAPVWQRLQSPLTRMSPADLAALQRPNHPFWGLLDRIAALSAVQAGSDDDMQALVARLHPVLAQLETGNTPPSPLDFDSALAEVESLRPELPAASPEALESALDQESRRREIEPAVRNQLVDQLRRLRVPALVQQFLLGPWVEVLTSALVEDGAEAPTSQRWMNAVADFTSAVSRQRRGHALTEAERQPLLDVAREGMEAAGLQRHRIDGSLFDLAAVLAHVPGVEPPIPDAPLPGVSMYAEAPPSEARLAGDGIDLGAAPGRSADALDAAGTEPWQPWEETESKAWLGHASLETVPMAFADEAPEALAQREAWVSSLRAGSICRLMLQGRWVTALLVWRSDNGQFFMFRSRHAGGTHTLTRRVMERLRGEGLATRVEPGQTLAKALRALPSAGEGGSPLGA